MAIDLALRFLNTARWHASPQPEETLHSYAHLLDWMEQAEVLLNADAQALAQHALHSPNEAEAVLARAIALREALYRLFVAHIHEQPPAEADLALLNHELAHALAQVRLAPTSKAYSWAWAQWAGRLDSLLWPMVRAAADLLTSPELLARVGQCADDRGCGWFFLDLSKNRSRRWCDINDCGNRAKQQRHYRRVRAARER